MKKNGLQILFYMLLCCGMTYAQSIPASDGAPTENGGTSPCAVCAPTGWIRYATTDISDQTQGGGINSVSNTLSSGMGLNWIDASDNVITLPAPPNGHTSYISLRDLGQQYTDDGSYNIEENISTTISGLTPGAKYEVIIYAYTGRTESREYEHNLYDNDGNIVYTDNNGNGIFDSGDDVTTATADNEVYSGTYIEEFDYQIEGQDRTTISMEDSQNEWITVKAPFTATSTEHTLFFYPGYDSGYLPASKISYQTSNGVTPYPLIQSVLLSIDLNAINDLPTANDDTATTPHNTPVTLSNVTSNDTDDNTDGETIDITSVDLDPSTPGKQSTLTTSDGTWTVDDAGNVTFTPIDGFTGTTTIPYTVNDSYTQNGEPAPATSNEANLTVTVNAPLPVTLVSFEASVNAASVATLNWITASELNNSHFEIFYSYDGANFKYIDKLNSKADHNGNSYSELYYRFDHKVEKNRKVYYQLIQVDFDGRSEKSPIVSVRSGKDKAELITIYPNPVSNQLNVLYNTSEKYTVEIYNVLGQLVLHTNESTIDVTELELGNYIVKLYNSNNETISSKQIVIIR